MLIHVDTIQIVKESRDVRCRILAQFFMKRYTISKDSTSIYYSMLKIDALQEGQPPFHDKDYK